MWNSFEKDREILLNQYSPATFNKDSGLPFEEIRANIIEMDKKVNPDCPYESRCEMIKYILANTRVGITPEDFFADRSEALTPIMGVHYIPGKMDKWKSRFSDILDRNAKGQEFLYYTGDPDFSHTSPDWENLLISGISGFKKTAESRQGDFYKGIVKACEGAEIYFLKLACEARKQTREKERMQMLSDALVALTKRAPENFYEALLLIYLFFILQNQVENSYIREFGSLDMLLYPFYKRDIENGTFTKEQIRTLVKYFLVKLNAMKVWANQPFTLGGVEGQEPVNELSYILAEEFIKEKPIYVKVHVRYSPQLPDDFILPILKAIREGENGFVFVNNSVATRALINNGVEKEDATDYGIVGCYETFAKGELPCSCNGRINLLKAVEAVIFNGEDALTGERIFSEKKTPETYEEFVKQVKEYLKSYIDGTVELINGYEREYSDFHTAPFLSMTYPSCMEKGKDIYCGGAKYNSSSINLLGTASCADSIYAVKQLVYTEKCVTLEDLKKILKSNWQLNPELRHRAISLPKYGNNFDEVDFIARDVQDYCATLINGRENGHGGTYRMGTFSIDWRFLFGEKTGASPDGRLEKEPLSKNICASPCCDRRGVTAHILSATKQDGLKVPNGTVLDQTLHFSAVSGDDGLTALKMTLETFMARQGFAIQYNVLNPETLREAQGEPEKYENLQVRLCGWNAQFTMLSRKEQDEFIRQSEVL